MLVYASKFMELSCFASAFIADKRLKMNRFETGLNPDIKERMSVHRYASYVDLYDTAVNAVRVIRERSNYFNDQHGIKRKGNQQENSTSKNHTRGLLETITPTITCAGPSILTPDLM